VKSDVRCCGIADMLRILIKSYEKMVVQPYAAPDDALLQVGTTRSRILKRRCLRFSALRFYAVLGCPMSPSTRAAAPASNDDVRPCSYLFEEVMYPGSRPS